MTGTKRIFYVFSKKHRKTKKCGKVLVKPEGSRYNKNKKAQFLNVCEILIDLL
ncbi:hypothetical protein SUBVAR_04252 [Subdoligranulum variabile DSM 15176]|uniref:Uncharacterized protein n=1 Tax=Subdoligranulum variabile DSM 15176 TaxID=411471 RepID=D1PIT7_9FIRM|nr:hypothetical protein SUBVAR_04252 [Subdoligranulum variabile DSM 15176]